MTSIRSFIKQIFEKQKSITVVSGLPRSGTSMMMAALEAGGMTLVIDGVRNPDDDNPKGYYEYERVKKLPQGETDWLKSVQSKGIKIISALLTHLPEDYRYQVIFMERDIDEVLASQQRMLERRGKEEENPVAEAVMRQSYQDHLDDIKAWLSEREWIQTIYVSYNEILQNPENEMEKVAAFLDHELDVRRMVQVVDPGLYRQKK